MVSDTFFIQLGFTQVPHVPQLFIKQNNGKLEMVAIKIVDHVLIAGRLINLKETVKKIGNFYELGTITYGPGSFQFYGLRITQHDLGEITIDGDEKLNSINPYVLTRSRRKECEETLNAIEQKTFQSVNGAIGWLGISASPFCSLVSSYLQQRSSKPSVHDRVTQINMTKHLKRLGTLVRYKRPNDKRQYRLSVVVFSDASKVNENGQLGYIMGTVIGDIQKESIIHVIDWSSSKSKRPAKSIGSAETIAASNAIDDGKIVRDALSMILKLSIDLIICVHSKDLFDTLTTCHNATDKSIRGDIAFIRYEFEFGNVNHIIWLPGKHNFADPVTKPNSPLESSVQLMMFGGVIPIELDNANTRKSEQFYG